jgi:hypothetical protein
LVILELTGSFLSEVETKINADGGTFSFKEIVLVRAFSFALNVTSLKVTRNKISSPSQY